MSGPSITNPANATPTWGACSPVVAVTTGGQTTTAAAVRMAASPLTTQVTIHASKANVADVAIGPAGVSLVTGYLLSPGDSVTLQVPNTNLLYLIGANTSDKITWIGF